MDNENRKQIIKDFLFDPERTIYQQIEEFKTSIETLVKVLSDTNLSQVEVIAGKDGENAITPTRGEDYFNEADITAFESFIMDKMPEEGIDYPTFVQLQDFISQQVDAIPRIQGEKGASVKGDDGKDGSPDTGKQILEKLRALDKNKSLQIKDIRGLDNKLKSVEDLVDELEKKIDAQRVVVSTGAVGGSAEGGTWGSITGTLADQTDLQSALDLKANDSAVVKLTGAQTIAGAKTFSTPIATASVATMTATVGGGVPTPPNNTTTFLRGDGTFATPAGGGTVTSVTSANANLTIATTTTTPVITIVSAPILTTARTIAGVSFNGSENIAIASTNLSDTALLARLASPTFTGTPTLPTGTIATTQTAGNSTTAIATTAFATTALNLKADLASRVLSATSYTTNTGSSINADSQDMFIVTAQAGALLFNAPSGTHTDGQKLIITVASSTTVARALTWNAAYGATTIALPTTTAATTATLTIGFIWSTSKSLWQCVAVA